MVAPTTLPGQGTDPRLLELPAWLDAQRAARRNGELKDWQIDFLDEAGMSWEPRSENRQMLITYARQCAQDTADSPSPPASPPPTVATPAATWPTCASVPPAWSSKRWPTTTTRRGPPSSSTPSLRSPHGGSAADQLDLLRAISSPPVSA